MRIVLIVRTVRNTLCSSSEEEQSTVNALVVSSILTYTVSRSVGLMVMILLCPRSDNSSILLRIVIKYLRETQ